jgi:predicted DNA-binding transcriptional regulator YafY
MNLPPLLLDDEETLAVAVSLRAAAGGSVTGVEEASVRALAKLQTLLPSRLRRRVAAFQQYVVPVPAAGPRADPSVLTTIAAACRDQERLRFDYRSHDGHESRREAEPYRLIHDRRRWYLVGGDVGRDDWRTFRADRITPLVPGGPRFTPRPLPPDEQVAEWVARGVGTATWRYRARVVVEAPAGYVRSRMPVPVDVRPLGPDRCEFTPGSDDPYQLAVHLGMLDADFTVADGPELVAALDRLADRCRRSVRGS